MVCVIYGQKVSGITRESKGTVLHHLNNLPIITESFVLKVTGSMGNVSAIGLCIDRDGEYLYFTIFFQGPGKLFRIATGNIPELKTFLINKHN